MLLNYGASPEIAGAFHFAAEQEKLEIITIILQHCSPAERQKLIAYHTTFIRACQIGNIHVIRLLLEYGADVNIDNVVYEFL